jgi:pSer/pThr/pTyr-binding forkhead associated (FHA) protein
MTSERVRTIGRGPSADFIIDAPLISRLHCRLTVDGKELIVEDLGSTNGISVNDHEVQRSTLQDGDRLRIGRVELIIATN